MFAEEFVIVDAESLLWSAARPVLESALRLERQDEDSSWHGWRKAEITAFLRHLPTHCTLLVGVWHVEDVSDVGREERAASDELREVLMMGWLCEVRDGAVASLRTFETLADPDLPPIGELEPGYQHAFALLRAARTQVAPVAWALFTDKTTWDEWLLAEGEGDQAIDKGHLLATLAQQGRCVLMGSQTAHRH